MLSMRRPSLSAWLSELAALVGPLPCRHFDVLPETLVELQAALLLLADQPQGGVALFRLSEAEVGFAAALKARVGAAVETLAPGLIRACEVVHLMDAARAVVVLSPMPALAPWAGPPDLRPVPGAGLDDLEEMLVDHAPQDVSAQELAAIPDLWDEPERALIALGALYPWRGGLVATVSGLLTYGAFDHQVLPGQRIIERTHGDPLPRLGDIGAMIEAPVESMHQLGGLPKRIATAILVNALALRRWDGRDEPVFVEVSEGRATVLCPDTTLAGWHAREGQRPNPNLDALLRRLEIWTGPMLDLRTIQQELRRAGLPPLGVEEGAGKLVLTSRVSPATVAPRPSARSPEPAQRRPHETPARPGASHRLSAEARAAQLLALLRASPGALTRHQIVLRLAWSRSTARAVLAALVAAGRVVPEATSPRSPHQRYRVA